MIADSQTSASFKSAIRYTTTEKNAQIRRDDLSEIEKMAAEFGVYNGRVSTVETRNVFHEDDPMDAAWEMQVAADLRERVEKPVYSVSVSYQVEDDPTDEEMVEDMDMFLEMRGLGEHQAVYVVHRDTDNPHIHATVNRIHPRSEELWRDSFDYYENMKALRQIERERGWSTPERDETRGLVPDWKLQKFDRLGEELFSSQVLEEAGDVFAEAESWKELQLELAEKGLTVKEKGSGGIVTDGNEEAPLSELARMWSFNRLDEGFPDEFRSEREIRQAEREEETDPMEKALSPNGPPPEETDPMEETLSPNGPPPGEMSDGDLQKSARELTQSLERYRDYMTTEYRISDEELHWWHIELKEERLEALREEMWERGLSLDRLQDPFPEKMTFEELIRERVARLDEQGERYREIAEEIERRDQVWTEGQEQVAEPLRQWSALKEEGSLEEKYTALDEAKRRFVELTGPEKVDLWDALRDRTGLERALSSDRVGANQAAVFDRLDEAIKSGDTQPYDLLRGARERFEGLSETEQEEVWGRLSDSGKRWLKKSLDSQWLTEEQRKVVGFLRAVRRAEEQDPGSEKSDSSKKGAAEVFSGLPERDQQELRERLHEVAEEWLDKGLRLAGHVKDEGEDRGQSRGFTRSR